MTFLIVENYFCFFFNCMNQRILMPFLHVEVTVRYIYTGSQSLTVSERDSNSRRTDRITSYTI